MASTTEVADILLQQRLENAGFIAGMKASAAATKEAAAAAEVLDDRVQRAGISAQTLLNKHDALARETAKVEQATRRFNSEMEALNREVARGNPAFADRAKFEASITATRDAAIAKAKAQTAAELELARSREQGSQQSRQQAEVERLRLAAMAAANAAAGTQAATMEGVASRTGRYTQALGQAGMQLQDFVVQVGAGQSALLAFAQQGSQMAGFFGPGGAIAGAVLAIAAISANFLLGRSSADKMNDALKAQAANYDETTQMAARYRDGLEEEEQRIARVTAAYAAMSAERRQVEQARLAEQRDALLTEQAAFAKRAQDAAAEASQLAYRYAGYVREQSMRNRQIGQPEVSMPADLEESARAVSEFRAGSSATSEELSRLANAFARAAELGGPFREMARDLAAVIRALVPDGERLETALARTNAQLDANTRAAGGTGAAMDRLGQSIRNQLTPLDELTRKLSDATAKLAAFRAGGAAGLSEAERNQAMAREIEASDRAELSRHRATLSPADAEAEAAKTAEARATAIRERFAAERRLEQEQAMATARQNAERQRELSALNGTARTGREAQLRAEDEANRLGLQGEERRTYILNQVSTATDKAAASTRGHTASLERNTNTAAAQAEGALRAAEAIDTGRAAFLRASAAAEAHKTAANGARGSEAELAKAILDRNAAQAASKGAEALDNYRQQAEAAEKMAQAMRQGPAAEHAAELDAKVAAATRDMLAFAEATDDPKLRDALRAIAGRTEDVVRNLDRWNSTQRDIRALQDQSRSLELLQREGELIGVPAAQRERELAALKEILRIEQESKVGRADFNADQRQRVENARTYADATAAIRRQTDALTELQNVGTTAFDRVGQSITEAFTQGKGAAVNFGTITKGVLSEVLQYLAKLAVVRPISNMLFGTNQATLLDATTAAGRMFSGGTGGAGAAGGDVMTLVRDASGAYRLANDASSGGGIFGRIGNSLGLTGDNGILSGIGNTVSGWWNAPLISGNMGSATNAALGAMPGSVYGPGGAVYGPATPAQVAQAGGYSGLSVGSALGYGAGVAGGLYGMYSGLQRGGVGGYTTAAGGLLGAAGSAVGAATSAGLLSSAGTLAALGPYGMAAGAVLAIVGSLLPGAKPSNKTGSAALNLETGESHQFGQTGAKFSQENRDAATGIANNIMSMTRQIETMLGANFRGGLVIDVGNRDGIGAKFNGGETRHYARDDAGMKALTGDVLRDMFGLIKGELPQALQSALGNVDFGNVETAMTRLAQLAEATGGGKPTETQNRAAIDYGNWDQAITDLKWITSVYEPLQKGAEAANEYQTQIDALSTKYAAIIETSGRLGLATDKVIEARDKEVAALAKQRLDIVNAFDRDLTSRERTLAGAGAADPLGAALEQFDAQAKAAVETATANLQKWGVLAGDQTSRILRLETVLAGEREKLIADTLAAQQDALRSFDGNLAIRRAKAGGDEQTAELTSFDLQAATALKEARSQLAALPLTAEETARRIAAIEEVAGQERAAIVKKYGDALAAALRGATEDATLRTMRVANGPAADRYALANQQQADLSRLAATLTAAGANQDQISQQVAALQLAQAGERAQQEFAAAQSAYVTATQQQIGAAQEQVTSLQANTTALAGLATNLRAFVRSLAVSDVSNLTPQQRLAELHAQFKEAVATAGNATLAGTERAAAGQQAQTLGQQLLTEAASYYGKATGAYGAEYAAVSGQLEALAGGIEASASADATALRVAESQLSVLQQQLQQAQALGQQQIASLDALRQAMLNAFQGLAAAQAAAAAATNTGQTVASAPTASALVTGWYRDQLGRAPDAPGLSAWTGALNAGQSVQSVQSSFTAAAALERNTSMVAGLYQSILGRAPDAAGLANWVAAANAGMNLDAMTKAFTDSPEYRTKHGLQAGGWVGNGLWDRDSVVARLAGGGEVALAGGEFVVNARSAARYSDLLPRINGGTFANDNRVTAEELRALLAELQALRAVVAQAGLATVEAVERGNGLAAQGIGDRKLALAR